MRVGIGFSNAGTLSSRIITWATDSPVSHTFLVVVPDEKPESAYVMQSTFTGGFRKLLWPDFQYGLPILAVFEPNWDLSPGVEWFQKCIGDHWTYNPRENLADAIMIGLKMFGIRGVHNWFARKGGMNCSDAVMNALKVSRYPSAWDHPEDATPQDCLTLVARCQPMAGISWNTQLKTSWQPSVTAGGSPTAIKGRFGF